MNEKTHPGLYEFLARHDPDSTRVIADWWPERDADGNSPLVIVRHGKFTAVLALMPFDGDNAHLCIDIHPFADGEDATAGVFGMTEGRRETFPATGSTSHGWPSMHLISVLIGEQAEAPPAEPDLREHCRRLHPRIPLDVQGDKAAARWHGAEHRHYGSPSHYHGPDPGPHGSPRGWRDGSGVVMVDRRAAMRRPDRNPGEEGA